MKELHIDLNMLSDEGLRHYLALKEELEEGYDMPPDIPDAPKYEENKREIDELPDEFSV